MAAMHGTIRRVIIDKGFGFIKGDDGREYFFHKSNLRNAEITEMTQDDKVTFEDDLEHAQRGPRAKNVYLES